MKKQTSDKIGKTPQPKATGKDVKLKADSLPKSRISTSEKQIPGKSVPGKTKGVC